MNFTLQFFCISKQTKPDWIFFLFSCPSNDSMFQIYVFFAYKNYNKNSLCWFQDTQISDYL